MELKTEGLYRDFDGFIFDTDISASEGELVCLLGPSGCGKTTALRMIAGITLPEEGRIYLDGRDITRLPPWKRNIGLVFQDYALFPHLSVFENIAYGLRTHRWKDSDIRERVEELMELVHLPDYAHRKPASLSGGEQQRVALGRALAPYPSLLLLDEPLSALDAQLRKRLRREIRSIQRRLGLTTIYVTHDQEEALTMSDRIILMREGRVEQSGSPREMYRNPSGIFAARFLGNSNLIPPQGGASSEEGVLFFRPEDTLLSLEPPKDASEHLSFHLPIRYFEFLGSHYIAEGELPQAPGETGGETGSETKGDSGNHSGVDSDPGSAVVSGSNAEAVTIRATASERIAEPGDRAYFSVRRERTRMLRP